ncbi:MAG: ABC transporter permease [Acidimicrobiia bacterium]|nr:ABC transporter permease [Acidimicrobiia bacterium]NNL28961.1 ABC transporter permease [Acidimicrobiia bacterium]
MIVNSAVRILAIVRKEFATVLRQPRLLATLILGPFVILALMGFGYRTSLGPLKTVVVANPDTELGAEIAERIKAFGNNIDFQEIQPDELTALGQLRAEEIDLVVTIPPEPAEIIRAGESAVVKVTHNQLDPFEQATIALLSRSAIDTVNRSILEELVIQGQNESSTVEILLADAGTTASLLKDARATGNVAEEQRLRAQLSDQVAGVNTASESVRGAMRTLERLTGQSRSETSGQLVNAVEGSGTGTDDEASIEELETELEEARASLAEFRSIPAQVLVSPFESSTTVTDAPPLAITDFYAPGAMVLLLQHLAITFAALSFVRERALGTPELFTVSPIRPIEVLIGKYIGFFLVSIVIGASLSALMFWGLRIPFEGSLAAYAAVLVMLLVVSLGIGFVISAAVGSDIQAVNIAMIILLLSLFFSGFFISIDRLQPGVRAVSWGLPATHAIDSLRDVMFRGAGIDTRTLLALLTGIAGTFAVAWHLTSRRLAPH